MDMTRFYNQFREETSENIRIFGDGMLVLEKDTALNDPDTREQLGAIFRAMHTIKGSARLLGFGAIGRLAHTMEHILGAVRDGQHTVDRDLIDVMLKSGDALLEMTQAAVEGGTTSVNVDELVDKLNASLEGRKEDDKASDPPAAPDTQSKEAQEAEAMKSRIAARKARVREQRKARQADAPAEQAPAPESAEPSEDTAADADSDDDADDADAPIQPGPTPSGVPTAPAAAKPQFTQRQTVRVRVDRLDKLINLTGELVVGKQVLADHAQALFDMSGLLQQQERELLALDTLLRTLRLPPEQRQSLDRSLNSLLNSNDQFRRMLRRQNEQFGYQVEQQGLLINDLEQEVLAARMLPVSNVFASLPRAVRELANATNKEVHLDIRGETTEMDRKLLEALSDPLLHLIRNAIDHGIESPDQREAAGKARQGRVAVGAEAVGGEVHITIRDDGRGLNPQKLRDIAVKKNLISKENAALLSDQEALELIFLPGFSSASMITDISGRGVGMDVVRTNMNELGGQVMLESQLGHGTEIRLVLPLTIVTTRILLIHVGTALFALPASGCHGIIWAYRQHIQTIEGRPTMLHEGHTIPFLHIADLMDLEAEAPFTHNEREAAVLIGSPQRLLSVMVSQLVDEQEAVVKPLGVLLERQRRYSGAVQLGDGRLVLLLNPVWLVQSARGIAQKTATVSTNGKAVRRPQLLIAEDSFTTRELIRSILQSAGYDVTAAIDGHDALDKLRGKSYDLVVTDVEMPRVNGFELTSRIRNELGDHDTPVIIITSLASDEYRQRGMEAGAQAYIVKSQFNQDNLLNVIQQLLGHELVAG
jgi:two-component system, chemotaxis family, sensor kinase CheA